MLSDITTASTGPFLDLAPDPAVWLVGPTPERPTEVWLPQAVDVQAAALGVGEERAEERELVRDVLGLVARRHPSPLPLVMLRWIELASNPFALFIGLVERAPETDLSEPWLTAADTTTLEPPVVDEVTRAGGPVVHRGTAYSWDEDGGLVVGVRYVVDTAHPTALVLAHAGSDMPVEVLDALDDTDRLLATVTVTDEPPR